MTGLSYHSPHKLLLLPGIKLLVGEGAAYLRGSILAFNPSALGFIPKMLLRLINGVGKRKGDSGLKMLIEPM